MALVASSGSRLVGATLLGFLVSACAMSACAQTSGRIPAPRDSVIIGVADTAAHLYPYAEGNGPGKPARRVIREQRDLDEVWSTLGHLFAVPRIDFSQNDVLVAAFGASRSAEPAINIDTVLIRGAKRIVVVRVTDISEQCLTVAPETTYPIDIVAVPHDSTRTTQFVERRAILPGCSPSQSAIHRDRLKPPVPALPPDRVPTFPAGGLVSGAPLGRDSVERGVVIVLFFPNTPQAARQTAIDAIQGSVIGGSIIANGDGFYYLRIPDDGTAASVAVALTALDSMPQVEVAIPAEPNSLSAGSLDAPALRDSVIIGVADTAAHLYRDFEENGPRKPARRVIREQRDLDEVWSTLDGLFAVPRIDFSQNDVLVAAFGASSSVGPAINIDTVLIRDAKRIVVVRVTDINERCLAGQAVTYPIDIVVVPHDSTRTTQFVERTASFPDCHPGQNPIRPDRRP